MHRLIPVAAVVALFAFQAQAQTDTQAAPAPATQAPAAAAPAPATAPAHTAMTKKAKHHHRRTLQQHFDAANTTHDGHLTKDQAAAANWSYVVNHFAAMDKDKKGYVTVQDIHAYAKSRHAAHHKAAPAAAQPKNG